jgi:hypothetical protein
MFAQAALFARFHLRSFNVETNDGRASHLPRRMLGWRPLKFTEAGAALFA